MWLATTPFGGATYKHFGVVDYVFGGGALNDKLDVYQQWPGFFAAAAALVRLSGRGPLAYSNWAELLFQALNSVVIFAIARRFSQGNYIVPFAAVLLYVTIDWEGGQYYAPQTLAFLLTLAFQYFLLPLLEPARLRRPFSSLRWLRIPQLDFSHGMYIHKSRGAVRSFGLATIFVAIIIVHQLSPYMVFAGVIGLWVVGVLRRPLFILLLAAMLAAYPLLHLPAVDHTSPFSAFDFSNAVGNNNLALSTPQQALGSLLGRTLCAAFWCLTAVCGLSYRRRFGIVAIPVLLSMTPLSLILVSSYGGEAIFRVFLFSSPWCAIVIAKRLGDLRRVLTLRLTVLAAWAILAALGSSQAAEFGQYPAVQVPSEDISASEYFLNHAPTGADLVLAASNFPSRLNRRYVLHNTTQSPNDFGLDTVPQFEGNGLDRTSPRALARYLAGQVYGGSVYLVVASSMNELVSYYGTFTSGTLPTLVRRLESSPYWHVWYDRGGVEIFQAILQGAPKGGHGLDDRRR